MLNNEDLIKWETEWLKTDLKSNELKIQLKSNILTKYLEKNVFCMLYVKLSNMIDQKK